MENNNTNSFGPAICMSWLTDSKGRSKPTPDLLTAKEVISYLRLNELNLRFPMDTLARYRKKGLIKGVQISKAVLFPKSELDLFIKKQKEENLR